jgi:hypothetical protein
LLADAMAVRRAEKRACAKAALWVESWGLLSVEKRAVVMEIWMVV